MKELIDFYNYEMGGTVADDIDISVTTDAERENKAKSIIKTHVSSTYSKTTVDRIEVNSNIGTVNPDDFIILIYLQWDVKNSVGMTQTMLEMYSDDMAATLAEVFENDFEVYLFWEVPYLLEKGTCAKYSYYSRDGKAYEIEKTGPLYY